MTEVQINISDLQAANNMPTKLVKVIGQLDESNVDMKIKEVYAVLQANPNGVNLIFDFEELQYMNSKSIGYLTDLYGKVTEKGGKTVVSKCRPNIEDILQVVGLNQLIPLVSTNEEAMMKLQGATSAMQPAAPQQSAPQATTPVQPAMQVPQPQVTPAPQAETQTPVQPQTQQAQDTSGITINNQ